MAMRPRGRTRCLKGPARKLGRNRASPVCSSCIDRPASRCVRLIFHSSSAVDSLFSPFLFDQPVCHEWSGVGGAHESQKGLVSLLVFEAPNPQKMKISEATRISHGLMNYDKLGDVPIPKCPDTPSLHLWPFRGLKRAPLSARVFLARLEGWSGPKLGGKLERRWERQVRSEFVFAV